MYQHQHDAKRSERIEKNVHAHAGVNNTSVKSALWLSNSTTRRPYNTSIVHKKGVVRNMSMANGRLLCLKAVSGEKETPPGKETGAKTQVQ